MKNKRLSPSLFEELLQRLRATYPDAHCELNYSNPLQLLIATILSARCTDKQVNKVTEHLFRVYKTPGDFAHAAPAELEEHLKQLGLFRNKARAIRQCCQTLVQQFSGKVPANMEDLLTLDGVGRKTANVVLGNAYQIESGVVVDTHVTRLAQRLGLTRHTKPEEIEQDLMTMVPQRDWTLFSHWLIWHGRRRCFARNPDCAACELRDLCPARETLSKANVN